VLRALTLGRSQTSFFNFLNAGRMLTVAARVWDCFRRCRTEDAPDPEFQVQQFRYQVRPVERSGFFSCSVCALCNSLFVLIVALAFRLRCWSGPLFLRGLRFVPRCAFCALWRLTPSQLSLFTDAGVPPIPSGRSAGSSAIPAPRLAKSLANCFLAHTPPLCCTTSNKVVLHATIFFLIARLDVLRLEG
jgi:hypothetical protein